MLEERAIVILSNIIFSGCGVPPAITNIDWECEEGYSGENHSVYFPCQGRCNVTTEVHYHAYCNATLQWEITEVITDNKCEGNYNLLFVSSQHKF